MSSVFLPFPSPKYSTKSLLNVVQVLNKTEETVENMVDYIINLFLLVTFISQSSEDILYPTNLCLALSKKIIQVTKQ